MLDDFIFVCHARGYGVSPCKKSFHQSFFCLCRFSNMTLDSEDVYQKPGWGRKQFLVLFVCSLLFMAVGVGIGFGVGRNHSNQEIPTASGAEKETATSPPRYLWKPPCWVRIKRGGGAWWVNGGREID